MMQPVRHSEHGMSLTEQVNTPPASVEAEQALLGGLMLDNHSWDMIASRVSETDFYRPDHRLIFDSLKTLSSRDRPRDAITVSEYLDSTGVLGEAGGLAYLSTLVKDTPSAANIVTYADIVRERALLRELITVGNDIASSAFHTEGRPATELVDEAEKRVFEIADLKI
jgi:replicative DNA helicase